MLVNLVLGLPTMMVCLLLQASLLVTALHYYKRHEYLVDNPSMWASLVVISSVMLLLLAGNLAQISIWALLFQWLGEFERFGDAFYHSAVNFSTLGYGDIVMSEQRKLLGPLEAVNGILMVGISTAMLMAALQDAIEKTLKARGD